MENVETGKNGGRGRISCYVYFQDRADVSPAKMPRGTRVNVLQRWKTFLVSPPLRCRDAGARRWVSVCVREWARVEGGGRKGEGDDDKELPD